MPAEETLPHLGLAPKLFDSRWFQLVGLGVATIVGNGVRMNGMKILAQYNPETGAAFENAEDELRKPLLLASLYYLGMLLVLPFGGWPQEWPSHLTWKVVWLVCLGAVGGITGLTALTHLPVTIYVMIRAAGVVIFIALGSAYITGRSSLNLKMGLALAAVLVGVCVAALLQLVDDTKVYGISLEMAFWMGLALFSCVPHAGEFVVTEDILQDKDTAVDVLHVSALTGVMGITVTGVLMLIAQLLPGSDHGALENSIHTFSQIFSSWVRILLVVVVSIAYMVDIVAAFYITKAFGATTQGSVRSFQVIFVWAVAVSTSQSLPSQGLGSRRTGWMRCLRSLAGWSSRLAFCSTSISEESTRRRQDRSKAMRRSRSSMSWSSQSCLQPEGGVSSLKASQLLPQHARGTPCPSTQRRHVAILGSGSDALFPRNAAQRSTRTFGLRGRSGCSDNL